MRRSMMRITNMICKKEGAEGIVTGESLHIGKLSLDGGELHVDGRIDSLLYEDTDRPSGGLLSRLFGG